MTQRMREIGIRLALGASPEGVFTLILRNGLSLTLTGLAIGLVASYFLCCSPRFWFAGGRRAAR